jgi:release factor glutamine methyltransferase
MTTLVTQVYADLVQALEQTAHTADNAATEAWWMLESLTGQTRSQLLLQPDYLLTVQQATQLASWVDDRITRHKPLQYILGDVPFLDLTILVVPPILIPRPETEEWVAWLIEQLRPYAHQPLRILDLCTGSGCIALALAKALPQARVVGVDINPAAVELAKRNQHHNNIDTVTFYEGDLYAALPAGMTFDLIVSNPPYISAAEYQALSPVVKDWEDVRALEAADDGLAVYCAIAHGLGKHLAASSVLDQNDLPQLVFELGLNYKQLVKRLAECGLYDITLHQDLQGAPRWLGAKFDKPKRFS